ncbi:glycosyltransferase family 2 protein [Alteromonas sp. P256]|uniref:glycosyltransferase family 2 protein n=1 Tax=Alteromonas sp. P256 TaxID=3117399 RepID=UPI002FE31460
MTNKIQEKAETSIVIPVYNRAKFIINAIKCIEAQTYKDWELIIVDDGSTDNLSDIVSSYPLNLTFLKQENAGPGAARQAGTEVANGTFIAFYDSDDEWKPNHLEQCIYYLKTYPEVDWVYTALKRVNHYSKNVVEENSFFKEDGKPKAFQELKTLNYDSFHIINDKRAALYSIQYGIEACFQCSVVKREVLSEVPIRPYRIGEDRLFITEAIKSEIVIAYLNEVTVIYNIHDSNISDTDKSANLSSRVNINLHLIQSYVDTLNFISNFTKKEKRAIRKKIADELFWGVGYSLYWQSDKPRKAFKYFFKAFKYYNLSLSYYKTTVLCFIRLLFEIKK